MFRRAGLKVFLGWSQGVLFSAAVPMSSDAARRQTMSLIVQHHSCWGHRRRLSNCTVDPINTEELAALLLLMIGTCEGAGI